MTSLDKASLSALASTLSALRDELLAQLDRERRAADTVDLDQTKVGRLSRMDALQQQSMAQSTVRNISSRLRLVNQAIAKLESGDYGYCDDCGEVIDLNRLTVRPEAPCCFACQSKQEYHPQS